MTPAEAERVQAQRIARATLRELLNLRARIDEQIEAARAEIEATRRGVKPACGTEKGYQWHRYHDRENWPLPADDPCGCKAAHAAYARAGTRAAAEAHWNEANLWTSPKPVESEELRYAC